jgi:hypothetical protein
VAVCDKPIARLFKSKKQKPFFILLACSNPKSKSFFFNFASMLKSKRQKFFYFKILLACSNQKSNEQYFSTYDKVRHFGAADNCSPA